MHTPKRRVLLVEDDPDNRFIFRVILEHRGHEIIEAADGEAAIELARSAHPDLILMDISLPRLDGWSAIRILRADPLTGAIPIMAVTAFAAPADQEWALSLGCAGYLAKPVALVRVVAEVDRIFALPGGIRLAPPAEG